MTADERPFDDWEGDHTDLVHVLWAARNDGVLSREVNCDELASRIMQSRWHRATRDRAVRQAATGVDPERLLAMIRLLGPGELTPTAKRQFESLVDA